MDAQKGFAVSIGATIGTIVYLYVTFINTTGLLNFYLNLQLGGLLIILAACYISGIFYSFIAPFIIIYEKLRYKGPRPHRELETTNDESIFLTLFITLLLAFVSLILISSTRVVYGVIAGVLATRLLKFALLYKTGYSCRMYWPFTCKSTKSTEVMPEGDLLYALNPTRMWMISFLFLLYIITIPIVQRYVSFLSMHVANGFSSIFL
jgi:hypothetical protein